MSFKPQETTLNSHQDAERELFAKFKSFGYSDKLSESIAHLWTHYMLGYITAEGAAQYLVDAGADEDEARVLAEMFRDARDKVEDSERPRRRAGDRVAAHP